MTDKTITKEFYKVWDEEKLCLKGCPNEYCRGEKVKEFLLTQIDLAEKRGEEKAKKEIRTKLIKCGEDEIKGMGEDPNISIVAGIGLMLGHIGSLKQSQDKEIQLTAEEEQLKKELLDIANGTECPCHCHTCIAFRKTGDCSHEMEIGTNCSCTHCEQSQDKK